MKLYFWLASFILAHACHPTLAAQPTAADYDASVLTFRKTLTDLVRAKTVNPPGNEARAVDILQARLKAHGIKGEVIEFGPGRSNLIARLKGTGGKKPLLLLAHIDVVGADNQAWTVPPYDVTEKDGYLYGRGVRDDLGMAVANLEIFLQLKKQKAPLKRDVILAFTGDEESGGAGIKAVLEKKPDLLDAEIALNEGGGIVTDTTGKVLLVNLVSAEKTYQDFALTVKGSTGHSSVPQGVNSIEVLAQGLERFSRHKENDRLLPVTREYFRQRAAIESPEIARAMKDLANSKGKLPAKALAVIQKNPVIYALLHTTCVPTMLGGGTRVNALPSEATANINCRILPDETIPQVQKRLQGILRDPRIVITAEGDMATGGASDIQGPLPSAVQKLTQATWPGVPVIAAMVNGATDARFLRNRGMQVYGLSPLGDPEADAARAHGIDERILVSTIRPGLEFYYNLVSELAL